MTLQTRLFTGPLAAAAVASSLPASHEQQQATSPLSLNSPLNKHVGVARERNLSRMQLFTQSLGMFEWLPLFSIFPHLRQPRSCLPVCLCRDLGGTDVSAPAGSHQERLLTVAGAAGYSTKMLL